MRYKPTPDQLTALGVTPAVASRRSSVAVPQAGEIAQTAAVQPLTRVRPRFYHRVLKALHRPHWYRLEAFEGAYPNGDSCRTDYRRGNVVAYCDPAGCGDIRFLHPFKANPA
jgi:hypothetical protein